ncbi:MAG TPA: FG-GAP repeat protein, partial [Gammaproteobacteria bacterium]|nr:FG-GAP repeat protein [Gammaproteobacteria bacterium]
MILQIDTPRCSRACFFTLAPLVFLLSAFSLTARAATTSGLFSAVTPITASVPAYSYLGYASDNGAALSADGRTALVGASYAPVGATFGDGKAFIYHYANGQWTQAAEIDDPDAATSGGYDYFGYTVAMSADGTAALIGSWATAGGQTYAGKAYLYTLSNGTWSLAHEFDDPAPAYDDGFGASGVSVSAHGKTVAVSAAFKSINSISYAGELYVFSDASGTWTQTAAIPDPDGAKNDSFGYALSLAANGTSLMA